MVIAALIAQVLDLALGVYWWLIIAEVLLSWVPRGPGEPRLLADARRVIRALTEPYLGIFRKFIPVLGTGGVGIDLSPLVGLIVLSVVRGVLPRLVFSFAALVIP